MATAWSGQGCFSRERPAEDLQKRRGCLFSYLSRLPNTGPARASSWIRLAAGIHEGDYYMRHEGARRWVTCFYGTLLVFNLTKLELTYV